MQGRRVSHRLLLCVALSLSLGSCGPDTSPETRAKAGKSLLYLRNPHPVPLEEYLAFPYGGTLHGSDVKLTSKEMNLAGHLKSFTRTFRVYEDDGSPSLTSVTTVEFYSDGRVKTKKSQTEAGRISSVVTYTYNPDNSLAAISEVNPIISERYSVTFKYDPSGALSRIAQLEGDVEESSIEVRTQGGRPTELVGKTATAEQWRIVYDYRKDGSVMLTRFSKESMVPEKEAATFFLDKENRPTRVEYTQPDTYDAALPYREGTYTYEYLPNFMRRLHIDMKFPKLNDKCDLDVTLYPEGDESAGQVNSTGFAFANMIGPPGCMVDITDKQITRDPLGNVLRDRQGVRKVEELGRTLERAKYDTTFVYAYYD